MKNTLKTERLSVKTELDCGIVLIKLYEVSYKSKCNRNIAGENKHGKVIWQVEDINSPFIDIRPFNKEKIIAYNWIGMDYYIDIQTGKLDLVNKNVRPW